MHSSSIRRYQRPSVLALFAAASLLSLSCSEPSGPKTVAPPTNVTAVLLSPTSARISWTDGAGSDATKSYNVIRDGVKLAEVSTTSYVDNGLKELTTYRYAVSANGESGQVSGTSAEAAPLVAPDVTAPTITGTTPTNGSTGFQPATTVRVIFSEPMDASTLNTTTFSVSSAGVGVAGAVSYDSGTRTAIFTPTGNTFAPLTLYTVTVTTGAKDASGNALASNVVFNFTTALPPDNTPPTVVSSSPVNGATGVATATSVKVTFSEAMDASTISASSFKLTLSGGAVAGTVSYDAPTLTATFTPSSALSNSQTYTATVTNAARDAAGNPLASNFVFSFTTAAVVDGTPPTVAANTPANGATSVPVNSPITVTFSEAMNASTINGSTFTLSVGGTAVSGSVSYNPATLVATFTPTGGNLAVGQTYTATVTTGAKDAAGNSLASSFVFGFATVAPVDATPPTVVANTPANGASGVAVNAPITVTFSEPMNAATINGSSFTLSSSGVAVAGTVSYNTSTLVATFTPSTTLSTSQTYAAIITTGAQDVAGNSLSPSFTFSFATVAPVDVTPPTVSANTPSNGATNVAVNAPITVTFSEAMNASTITNSTFLLTVAGVPASGTVSYDAASRTATFTPAGGILAAGQPYSATVTTGVKDASGNSMAATFTFSFTTAQPPDNTPPTIVSRSPSPGASNVAVGTDVQVGFSEALNASTVSSGTFTVTVGGSPVSGSVSYDTNTRIAKFTPSAALGVGQTYTVTLTTGIRDLAGNALAANDVFTFSTAGAPVQNLSGEPIFQTTTNNPGTGEDEVHIHIRFAQSGTSLSLDPACGSGQCVMLPRNQAGFDIIGPYSPGEVWVNLTSLSGTINAAGQVTFTMTNGNNRTFTFTGTATNGDTLTGTLSGPTQPAIAAVFVRSN